MAGLGWTRGFRLFFGGSPLGRLGVPGQPGVDVQRAKLPKELTEQGACLEIRTFPEGPIRLFVWEDADAPVVTEMQSSDKSAKLRAEDVVSDMLERRARRLGLRSLR